MVSLARSSLIYESRRYLAAVLAVSFAGLLVLVQLALLLGLFGSVSVAIDRSGGDLWIGFPDTQSVDLGRAVSRHSDALAWIHPAVERVERYSSILGDVRRPDGVAVSVYIHLIDTRSGALAFSQLLSAQQRVLLDEPDAIVIDVADRRKLGVEIGGFVEINGKRARVAGAIEGIRSVGGASALASFASGRRFDANWREDEPTFFLIQLRAGANPEAIAQQLTDAGPVKRYSIWIAKDFSIRSQLYWLLESGAGIGAGVASLLGLIVGVVITSQTLTAAILATLKEYATLRALGVSQAALRKVVLEQAAWVALVGLAITAAITTAIAWIGHAYSVAMSFPVWLLAGTAVAIVLIALGSGIYALRPLLNADPATLLR